jgi:hypothetical protein
MSAGSVKKVASQYTANENFVLLAGWILVYVFLPSTLWPLARNTTSAKLYPIHVYASKVLCCSNFTVNPPDSECHSGTYFVTHFIRDAKRVVRRPQTILSCGDLLPRRLP